MDLQKSAQLAAFIHDLTLPGRVSQNFQTHPEETRAGQKVWDIQQLDQAHRNGKCRQSCGGGMFLSLPLSHSVSLCPALTWSETRSLSGSACNNAPPPRVLACLQLLAGNYSAMQCLAGFASENLCALMASPLLQTPARAAPGARPGRNERSAEVFSPRRAASLYNTRRFPWRWPHGRPASWFPELAGCVRGGISRGEGG